MSDGLDPRHGPYGKPKVELDAWVFELWQNLWRKGIIASDSSTAKAADEIKLFAEQVVKATRDGHFTEVT